MSGSATIEKGHKHGEVEPFDPSRVSASRVNAFLQCGTAFKRKYIDGEQPTQMGSAALFGNVMHRAAETWAVDRTQDMVSLTHAAWKEEVKGTSIVKFLEQYGSLSVECMKAERDAKIKWEADPRNKGKVSKAPRMTKLYKESKAAQDSEKLLASWLPKLNEDSPWRFTDTDPLSNLYDESLVLAKRYSRKYKDIPNALHTEFGFTVEWRGFILRGYIDSIEPVLAVDGYQVLDYKTYRQKAPKMKDWRQSIIYDIAFDILCQQGVLPFDPDAPRWVVFDYMRLFNRRDYIVGPEDREALFQELTTYKNAVEAGIFLPAHKNTNPDFCDFEDCCQKTRGDKIGVRGDLYPEEEDV